MYHPTHEQPTKYKDTSDRNSEQAKINFEQVKKLLSAIDPSYFSLCSCVLFVDSLGLTWFIYDHFLDITPIKAHLQQLKSSKRNLLTSLQILSTRMSIRPS